MATVQGKGGDEVGKLLKKFIKQLMKKDASKLKGTKPLRDVVGKLPYSQGASSEIKRALPKPKRMPKKVVPQKAASIPSVGSMGEKATVKGPKGRVERPKTPSLKGRRLAKTESEQRAAEKSANFYLRKDGKNVPKPPQRDARSGVSGMIPTVPKRSKSQPVGKSWQHEAERLKREAAQDRRNIGRGQPPRGGKPKPPKGPRKPPPTGGIKVKPAPKPKKPSGGAALVK